MDKEIIEGNRLIAEFLGKDYAETDSEKGYLYPVNGAFDRRLMPVQMQYHSSWDWLKPVIDQIFLYCLAHPEEVKKISDMKIVVDIIPAWEQVVNFCKWFNHRNTQQQ